MKSGVVRQRLLGLLLLLLGGINVFSRVPRGGPQTVIHYIAAGAMLALGLWLIAQKPNGQTRA
ncbi:hypothetical protein SAMN05421770_101768 [Granulicella rosea]|uniref:Uncharacterized protein n=1 Tax=Granulicella rosea TaxID=474952 RepID=A0A239E467_9BACT|nr:hypothetical protein [Granulicella rosea]SNS38773.1 hypothetical protein SAMN05421770_101768 [Granulicella rosea]